MRMKLGLRQAVISGAVFCVVLLALVSVDPRVRERMTEFLTGGQGLASWDERGTELVSALMMAVRYQSIENAPLLIFASVGAVLFVFMFRT